MRRTRVFLPIGVVLALAGCGGGDEPAARAPSTGAPVLGAPTADGGLSVGEAKASELPGPLMVRGYVISNVDEYRLCEAILESHPPQCGQPSLLIEGVDPAKLRKMRDAQQRVSLLGDVDGEVIRVAGDAQG